MTTMQVTADIEAVSHMVQLPGGRDVRLVERVSVPGRVLGITVERQVVDLTASGYTRAARVLGAPFGSVDDARQHALDTLSARAAN